MLGYFEITKITFSTEEASRWLWGFLGFHVTSEAEEVTSPIYYLQENLGK